MDTECRNLDNGRLLELIQDTIREWQDAESCYLSKDGIEELEDKNYRKIQLLKELYQSLIREAKERNLTLSKEQLFTQIITNYSDEEE